MSRLYPDESLSRELRNRSREFSWDGEPIWDVRWEPLHKAMAIVQRRKPEPKYPTGRWTIWTFLRNNDGTPRNITRPDINLIKEHVYGQGRRKDDWEWYKNLEEEERRLRHDDPDRELDDGIDEETKFVEWYKKPKMVMGAKTNKRYSHAQRKCPHNEWMVECDQCSPQERKTFFMSAKSGESNVKTRRGSSGSP